MDVSALKRFQAPPGFGEQTREVGFTEEEIERLEHVNAR